MLSEFQVLHDNGFGLHREIGADRGVSLWCFDDKQMVFAIITNEALQVRFPGRDVVRAEANKLVEGDLDTIGPVVAGKYQRREVERPHEFGAHSYPLIVVTMKDLADAGVGPKDDGPLIVGSFRFG